MMKKDEYPIAVTVMACIFTTATLSLLLVAFFLPESPLALALIALGGSELVLYCFSELLEHVWRTRLIKEYRATLDCYQKVVANRLEFIETAYNRWEGTNRKEDLKLLLAVLKKEVGEPHIAEETGG